LAKETAASGMIKGGIILKKYDSFLIGHISSDSVQELSGEQYGFYGGAGLFGSYAAHYMGARVGLLTKMAHGDKKAVDLLVLDGDDIYFIESAQNTSILNRYLAEDRERRDLVISSVADPFQIKEIPNDVQSEIFHIAGLIYGDYEDGMIGHLASRGEVAVDMQGYVRRLDPKTMLLYFQDYEYKLRDFPFVNFLKTDAAEAEILTGVSDREAAARMMCGWGAKEVMITHNSEVLICDGEKIYTCPIRSRNFSGRAGRGDTTFAVYITERLRFGIEEALAFATAAVSLKMERPGPLRKTRQDVENYMRLLY